MLHVGQNPTTQEAWPIKKCFPCSIGNSNATAFCQFGQVDINNEINGIARCITQQGVILEGNFKNGKEHGWIRSIHSTGQD